MLWESTQLYQSQPWAEFLNWQQGTSYFFTTVVHFGLTTANTCHRKQRCSSDCTSSIKPCAQRFLVPSCFVRGFSWCLRSLKGHSAQDGVKHFAFKSKKSRKNKKKNPTIFVGNYWNNSTGAGHKTQSSNLRLSHQPKTSKWKHWFSIRAVYFLHLKLERTFLVNFFVHWLSKTALLYINMSLSSKVAQITTVADCISLWEHVMLSFYHLKNKVKVPLELWTQFTAFLVWCKHETGIHRWCSCCESQESVKMK